MDIYGKELVPIEKTDQVSVEFAIPERQKEEDSLFALAYNYIMEPV